MPSPSLAAEIEPPCNSTRLRAIARPSPSPPARRAAVTSPCSKASKMRARADPGGCRGPVSVTTTRMRPGVGFSVRSVTRPPDGVNFAEFLRRFQKTCWSRAPSPSP